MHLSSPHSAPPVESETQWIKLRRKPWAALIRLIYEADPLLCRNCHIQMKIISLIKDGTVIDKILDHLQYNKRRSQDVRLREHSMYLRSDPKGEYCGLDAESIVR